MTQTADKIANAMPIPESQKQAVSDKTKQAQHQAGLQVKSQIDSKSTQAGSQILATSRALHASTDQLRAEGQTMPASILDQVASRGDDLGNYLCTSSGGQILADAEDFCRRQPWLVMGGGIILGFLGARFVKASAGREHASAPEQASPTDPYMEAWAKGGHYSPDSDLDLTYQMDTLETSQSEID